jgi:hypothetical protein
MGVGALEMADVDQFAPLPSEEADPDLVLQSFLSLETTPPPSDHITNLATIAKPETTTDRDDATPEIEPDVSVEEADGEQETLSGGSEWSPFCSDDLHQTKIQVELVAPPLHIQEEYEDLDCEMVEAILGQVHAPHKEDLFKVELRDGVIRDVSTARYSRTTNVNHR